MYSKMTQRFSNSLRLERNSMCGRQQVHDARRFGRIVEHSETACVAYDFSVIQFLSIISNKYNIPISLTLLKRRRYMDRRFVSNATFSGNPFRGEL